MFSFFRKKREVEAEDVYSRRVINPGYKSEAYPDGFGLVCKLRESFVHRFMDFDEFYAAHRAYVHADYTRYGAVFYPGFSAGEDWSRVAGGIIKGRFGSNLKDYGGDIDLHTDTDNGRIFMSSGINFYDEGRYLPTEIVLGEAIVKELKTDEAIIKEVATFRYEPLHGDDIDPLILASRYGMYLKMALMGDMDPKIADVLLKIWERIKCSDAYIYVNWRDIGLGVLVLDEFRDAVLHKRFYLGDGILDPRDFVNNPKLRVKRKF